MQIPPVIIAIALLICLAVAIWYWYLKPRPSTPRIEPLKNLDDVLPVLRNVHGDDDTFKLIVVNSPVCDGFGIFAAKHSILPDGMQFVQYIMKNDLKSVGEPAEESVMKLCLDNLAKGLQASEIERGEAKMISLSNPGRFGASAIAIPRLHANCVEWLGGEEFIAGAPNLDLLLVCRSDSPFRHDIEAAVDKAADPTAAIDFDPCLFRVTKDGITAILTAE
jgi:hypothetical protein